MLTAAAMRRMRARKVCRRWRICGQVVRAGFLSREGATGPKRPSVRDALIDTPFLTNMWPTLRPQRPPRLLLPQCHRHAVQLAANPAVTPEEQPAQDSVTQDSVVQNSIDMILEKDGTIQALGNWPRPMVSGQWPRPGGQSPVACCRLPVTRGLQSGVDRLLVPLQPFQGAAHANAAAG